MNALLVPVFADVFHLCIEALQTRVKTFRSPRLFLPGEGFYRSNKVILRGLGFIRLLIRLATISKMYSTRSIIRSRDSNTGVNVEPKKQTSMKTLHSKIQLDEH